VTDIKSKDSPPSPIYNALKSFHLKKTPWLWSASEELRILNLILGGSQSSPTKKPTGRVG
jgi:hypothetical protein